jgi:hypothetical protein
MRRPQVNDDDGSRGVVSSSSRLSSAITIAQLKPGIEPMNFKYLLFSLHIRGSTYAGRTCHLNDTLKF